MADDDVNTQLFAVFSLFFVAVVCYYYLVKLYIVLVHPALFFDGCSFIYAHVSCSIVFSCVFYVRFLHTFCFFFSVCIILVFCILFCCLVLFKLLSYLLFHYFLVIFIFFPCVLF